MATSSHLRRPRLPSPDIATASLLESLPPAMLDEIFCRLPIRDAARTSALSRFWRCRWKSVPYQVLHWPIGTPPVVVYDVLTHRTCPHLPWPIGIPLPPCTYDVVTHRTCPLLHWPTGMPPFTISGGVAHRTSPVREFRFRQDFPEQDFHLSYLWLNALAAVGVRSLSLTFAHVQPLNSSIFSCRELTVLDLEGCDMTGHPPGFGGFPNLTTLRLSRVGFFRGVKELETLISSSPSLQTLRLQDLLILDEHEHWVIQAPNLQCLLISEFDHGWQINNLPAIEVAEINCKYDHGGGDFVNRISVLDKARKLKLSTPFAMEDILEGLSRSFVNLRSLSLHIPLCYGDNILAIFYLVRNAPKLEALDIEHDDYWGVVGEPDINSINVPWADDLFSSLTSVDMRNVIWDPYEMLFIEFVLSKAGQLEVFSVHVSRRRLKSDEDALAEVAGYRRASPGANFVISCMP